MRSSNQDPYSRRKELFLDRTREERSRLATSEKSENLRDSLAQLPDYLAEIWAYGGWSAAKRRRIFFELWDECAESGSKTVVATADSARATILAFIRKTLGSDSEDGYTSEELRRLNEQRKSVQRFEPYG